MAVPDWTALERWKLHYRLRNFAHSAEYAVLAALAFHAVFVTLRTLLARIAAISLLLVIVVATTDELRQAFLPGRTGSVADLGRDLAGALVALALVVCWQRRSAARAAAEENPS